MSVGKRKKSGKVQKRISYFYLNKELHKAIKIVRSEDMLIAWNYVEGKRVAYNLSDAYLKKQHAYSIPQAAKILNRHVDTIKRHLRSGNIRRPQQTYSLDGQRMPKKYFFSEDEIREMYDFFKNMHIGRPRFDGEINNSDYMSKAELEALLRNEKVLYTKSEDGEFTPVWKQPEW